MGKKKENISSLLAWCMGGKKSFLYLEERKESGPPHRPEREVRVAAAEKEKGKLPDCDA